MSSKWIYWIPFFLLVICCEKKPNENQEAKFISFNSGYIRPSPVSEYIDSVSAKEVITINRNQDTVEYVIDLPFSGCARFSGDIKVMGDSLILLYKLQGDTLCTTLVHYELRYKILDHSQSDPKVALKFVDVE